MTAPPPAEPRLPWWQRPHLWLAVMVAGFFAISTWAGIACFSNLQFQNNVDAGIITQAVSSTTYGRYAPFFESYDCLVKSRCSFLLVHPGFVLYLATPIYYLEPSTITLFIVRSALVALSAIPLYWLTRQVTGSPAKALLAAGLFLAWGPSFLGDAFSLHLETILPLELFTLAALWVAGRYRLALVAALIGFLTMEIVPIFTFLVAVFFLAPFAATAVKDHWSRFRARAPGSWNLRASITAWGKTARDGFALRPVRYALVLMGASLVAYVVLVTFMNVWGPEVLGVITPPIVPGASGVFSNNSTPPLASIGTVLSSPQTIYTAEFWLVLYASLAFIPLFSPRSLILSVPWIGWTFLTDSDRFTTIGHQYTMIAAGPLFIGLAYGLRWLPPRTARTDPVTQGESVPAARPAPSWRPRGRGDRAYRAAWAGVLGIVLVGNVLLIPINPVLPDLGVSPGAPFTAGYYDHSLEWNPTVGSFESMIALIPHNATVTAPGSFFPLLANYPDAYVLVRPNPFETANLPFNVSTGPDFVFLNPVSVSMLSPEYRHNLSDPEVYGVRAYAAEVSLGPLFLYEKGYVGTPSVFGPLLATPLTVALPGQGLAAGPESRFAENATSPSGSVIAIIPGRMGLVATTTVPVLAPGDYTLEAAVAVTITDHKLPANETIVRFVAGGLGGEPLNSTYFPGNFTSTGWMLLVASITVPLPLPDFVISLELANKGATLAVAAVSVIPDASG